MDAYGHEIVLLFRLMGGINPIPISISTYMDKFYQRIMNINQYFEAGSKMFRLKQCMTVFMVKGIIRIIYRVFIKYCVFPKI